MMSGYDFDAYVHTALCVASHVDYRLVLILHSKVHGVALGHAIG